MTDTIIHLNDHFIVPTTNHSLLELVRQGEFPWPRGATCVTQDQDGALIWWNAPIAKVRNARKKAKPHKGLYSLLGAKQVVQEFYYEGEQEVVANDWQTAVVTLDQFTGSEH